MSIKYADRVREVTATIGNGAYTLDGPAFGYRSFSSALNNGDTVYYCCESPITGQWEIGSGIVNSNTLSRFPIISSNGTSAISWNVGPKNIFLTVPSIEAGGGGGGGISEIPSNLFVQSIYASGQTTNIGKTTLSGGADLFGAVKSNGPFISTDKVTTSGGLDAFGVSTFIDSVTMKSATTTEGVLNVTGGLNANSATINNLIANGPTTISGNTNVSGGITSAGYGLDITAVSYVTGGVMIRNGTNSKWGIGLNGSNLIIGCTNFMNSQINRTYNFGSNGFLSTSYLFANASQDGFGSMPDNPLLGAYCSTPTLIGLAVRAHDSQNANCIEVRKDTTNNVFAVRHTGDSWQSGNLTVNGTITSQGKNVVLTNDTRLTFKRSKFYSEEVDYGTYPLEISADENMYVSYVDILKVKTGECKVTFSGTNGFMSGLVNITVTPSGQKVSPTFNSGVPMSGILNMIVTGSGYVNGLQFAMGRYI